ncbi:MAG: hypothetical protein F6J93_10005 [Oscillatoria sp. SIO1A7]|nr:hypothetical protein [Oscillatoria sp. SIO1A7]
MGHWALGMGHGAWALGINYSIFPPAPLLPCSPAPLLPASSYAQCPMPNAQCPFTDIYRGKNNDTTTPATSTDRSPSDDSIAGSDCYGLG